MKPNNEIFRYLTPCAIVGGFALALATGSAGSHALAWCVFTVAASVCFCLVAASYQLSRVKPPGISLFNQWPVELDILLSSADDEQRILAAARIANLGRTMAAFPHRNEALKVLEYVAGSNVSDRLRASVLGAWTELNPENCPEWIINLAADERAPVYSTAAARAFVARTVSYHPELFKSALGRQIASSANSLFFMAPMLVEAWINARSRAEKDAVRNAVADIKNIPSNQGLLKKNITDRLDKLLAIS